MQAPNACDIYLRQEMYQAEEERLNVLLDDTVSEFEREVDLFAAAKEANTWLFGRKSQKNIFTSGGFCGIFVLSL